MGLTGRIAKIGSVLGMLIVCCLTGCAQEPPPRTVEHVDLDKYAGKWYEIARIPHLYEYNCVGSVDVFTPTKNGEMRVVHRCHQDTTYGYMREDVGTARATDSSNAKLRIDLGPTGGDFWVLALDSDYQYAVMGTPDRQSLWVISRKPTLPVDVDERLFRLVDDLGYDSSKVRRTPQRMGL